MNSEFCFYGNYGTEKSALLSLGAICMLQVSQRIFFSEEYCGRLVKLREN